ncbi:MAG: hypothetical protein IKR79_00655 [Bacteroidales bacterium]|nr:hypothetical protein [Bacteroidales bacterium]
MASKPDFVQFIVDQCSGAGEVTAKKQENGAKPHFFIEDVDDRDYLADLVRATCSALK